MALPVGFVGALTELRKATVSFVMSVHMEHLGSQGTDFHEILIFEYVSKQRRENSNCIKIGQE
jgi:hypothetical protein